MNILFVSSEVTPFAKTGGLADVSGALPKALKKLGVDIKVVMPRYYAINRESLERLPISLGVDMGSLGEVWAGVYKGYLPDSEVEIYFIEHEGFYGRSGLYTDEHRNGYSDNDIRFIFLSKAALVLSKALHFKPDIIHANDWHTASIPILLKTTLKNDPFFDKSRSILTIHNLQHQGVFHKRAMEILGVGWEHFNPFELEALDNVNFLKGGIAFCDALTTVSKKYAKEIQTREFGFGLEDHIRANAYKLFGILNGVDYDEWDPSKDRYLAKNYDVDSIEGKAVCKEDIQRFFNLKIDKDIPLLGFIGRFAEQKGIVLLASIFEKLMQNEIQFIILGSGEKWAESFFGGMSAKYKGKFGSFIGYNNELAHKIEAGCDLFLMPSLFEPCGLNQIYSLRYGTLPIVRATGGLDDTIINYPEKNSNGFKFWDATPEALYNTTLWAVDIFKNEKRGFLEALKRGMRERFSWMESTKEYLKVYRSVI